MTSSKKQPARRKGPLTEDMVRRIETALDERSGDERRVARGESLAKERRRRGRRRGDAPEEP